jgi:maleate cis-trans isomerase
VTHSTPVASSSRRVKIGWLAPFAELPGEVTDVLAEHPARPTAWQVVTESIDTHDLDGLHALSETLRLVEGARRLRRWGADVALWACTSGSFVVGRAGSLEQRDAIASAAGCPAGSTSLAFVEAVRACGADHVSVVASYPQPATDAFIKYLAEWGITVSASAHLDAPGARAAELITSDAVVDAIDHMATEQGELILLPDTAVWGIRVHQQLPAALGRRVITANQVTIWQALRLAELPADLPELGLLRNLRAAAL